MARNREILKQWLGTHEDQCAGGWPVAGVTAFPRLSIENVTDFCRQLAEEYGVLVAPGEAFERSNHIRIGYGGDTNSFIHALRVMSNCFNKSHHNLHSTFT